MTGERSGAWWWLAALGALAAFLVVEDAGARSLNRVLLYLPGVDKALHTMQSAAILGALYLVGGRTIARPRLRVALAVGGALGLAVFDEAQQAIFSTARHIEGLDVVAAAAGVGLGVAGVVAATHPWRAAAVCGIALAVAGLVTRDSYLRTRYYNEGLLLEADGRMTDALRSFELALQTAPPTADLYNALAWLEVEAGAGDAAKAVGYAERSLEMRPGDPDTLDTYGWALHKAGRSADALVPLTRALEAKPGIYCIHYHLGAAYLALGRQADARRHFELQVRQAPSSREAREAAGLLGKLAAPATLRP